MYYEVLWVKKQVVFLFLIHINSSLNKGLDKDHGKYYGKCSSIAAVPFELNGIKLLISQVNGALVGKENSFHPLRCCFMYDLLCFRTLFFFRQEDTIIKMIVATVLLWSYRHLCSLESGSLQNCQLLRWLSVLSFDLHFTFLTCIGIAAQCSVGGTICHSQHQLMSQGFIDLLGPSHLNPHLALLILKNENRNTNLSNFIGIFCTLENSGGGK